MTASARNVATGVAEMQSMLRSCRRRLLRNQLLSGALRVTDRCLVVLAVCAAGWLALRLLGRIAGMPSPSPAWALGGAAVLVVVLFAAEAFAVVRRRPGFAESAERLDLAMADHNRIATALCLLESGDASPFARSAAREGIEYLRRLCREQPSVETVRWPWRREMGLVVVTVLAAVLGLWAEPGDPGRPAGPEEASTPPQGSLLIASGAPQEGGEPSEPDAPKPADRQAHRGPRKTGDSDSASPRQRTFSGRHTSGLAGGTAPAQARESQQFTDSRGGGTDSPSSSRSAEDKRPGAPTARKSREARPLGDRKPAGADESSAVRGGSSGGGGMVAVHNPWSQKAQAVGDEPDEEEGDEEVEDEAQSSKQRGGIQPSLKDRNQSHSRELGISEGAGPPGSGRGGPTPPKKSRGTASLVLGVPVPDFVKGRLAPGTTKVTHERVDPAEMPGEPARPAEAAPRSLAESPVSRYTVPSGFAHLVREYLIALHSADRQVSPPQSASRPEKEEPK